MALACRPVQPDDERFLFQLYASTRAEELAAWGWDTPQQEAFLKMQFAAQQRHYAFVLPEADQHIILLDQRAIGRLIVSRNDQVIVLADIALLPEYRNKGIGARLILDLQSQAAQANKPVRLHVEKSNRAKRLYERLGFTTLEDTGVYFLMEWRPSA